jgi:regulator of sirC expression with transglutaminase-like and TPR domain
MASIENVLQELLGDFAAAQFYYQSNGDINKRTYIDKALEMSAENHFIFLRQRSLILARQGDKKGAIETAKLFFIAAEAAGNTDYVKMNKDSISEWSK